MQEFLDLFGMKNLVKETVLQKSAKSKCLDLIHKQTMHVPKHKNS